MGSENINAALLRDASVSGSVGVTQGNKLLKIWDLNDTVGGPILKDRLWFYGGFRYQGNRKLVAPGQMFYNANYADNTKFLYVADMSQPAKDDGTWTSSNVRLTWQQSQRSKMNFFVDSQTVCSTGCIYGGSATTAPEARTRSDSKPYVNTQVTWTSPMTNKILFEAGFSALHGVWGGKESDPNPTHDMIRITENCSTSAGCPLNGNIAGLTYRSQNWAHNIADTPRWQASASYVTGAHSLKFGYQGQWIQARAQSFTNTQALSYTLQNGVPVSFTMNGNNGNISTSRSMSAALYAQDQSTFGRLTVQGAVRYDRAWSNFPEQTTGGTRFLPQVFHWDATYGVKGYNDITPRMGAVYDLFGNGKTSLKVSLGRYLEAATNGVSYTTRQPATSISGTATRNWTDGNRNYVIDCDLFSTVAQDNRASGGDFCAALPTTFGTNTVTTVQDPRIYNGGWGIRPGDWNFTGSWQQEILPRASVEVSFTRRWFQGFGVTDNRALDVNSYDPYYVIAPLDSRLPGGGGYRIDGLLNVKPEFATVTAQNFATLVQFLEDDLGRDLNRYQYYNGVDVTFNMRMQNGIRFQGGTSTGHTVNDSCGVREVLPETGPTSYDCHTAGALLTRVTGLASYIVPKIDVLVSGTFQSNPPDALSANYSFTTAQVTPWLGRPLSNNAQTVSIDMLTSSEMYAPNRTNQVDFRIAKILKFGRTRTNVGVDLYNVFNRSTPQGYNTTFSPTGAWPRVTSVFPARFAKVSAQVDF